MRLIKSVERLEAAGAARAAEPAPVQMCWTKHETRVDAEELGPGEYIACDVTIEGGGFICIRERVTRDERDLGKVYEGAGAGLRPRWVGDVTAIDGTLLSWELFAPGLGA